jgi:uncharacterized protein YyaL (SSP411 family)
MQQATLGVRPHSVARVGNTLPQMSNRLANETSPYLLQHKDNPVDWYPWGDEAFAKAAAEDKPVFLSVGYSSCHWCHVMEHESFEDTGVAAVLNKHFVAIKVDREERPDIDEAYMTAVQLSAGRGGWPMSVFLTPDRKPFFAGTYFPKDDRGEYPGFRSILSQIASAWPTKRKDLQKSADEFAVVLGEALTQPAPGSTAKLDIEFLGNAVKTIASHFDPVNGGTAGAPKFPPHTGLDFLMRFALMAEVSDELRQASVGMALLTLEKICLGGIQDHVGGGFHRYSTDERWMLPHFEKMLSDNALLLGNLARGAMIASQLDERLYVLFYRSMSGVVAWVLSEMTSPEGLFYSALDADSEGVEGKFYVWTSAQVLQVLGDRSRVTGDGNESDFTQRRGERGDAEGEGIKNGGSVAAGDRAAEFLRVFNFSDDGNFADEATGQKTGENVLFLTDELGLEQMDDLALLAKAREKRVKPGLDDKAIVAWNALMISSLVEAGIGIGQAERAAMALLAFEKQHGSLPHQISKGRTSGPAFLDDYAYFAHALLALAALHGEVEAGRLEMQGERPAGALSAAEWLGEAARLVSEMVTRFYDEERGGFYYTSEDQEELFGRTKQAFDQPLPSPNSVAIRCLIEVGDFERAGKSLHAFLGWMEKAPTATEGLYVAAMELLSIAEHVGEMASAAHPSTPPSGLMVSGSGSTLNPVGGIEGVGAGVEGPSLDIAETKVPEIKREALPEVMVRLEAKELRAGSDGSALGRVLIEIPEGLHLNSSDPPARWLVPTALTFDGIRAEVAYPAAANDRYEGRVEIPFTVFLPGGESGADFELLVGYQACTESECLAPAEKRFSAVAFR